MYCPNCATPLANNATQCSSCNLDVAPIAHLLYANPNNAQTQRWTKQRHSLGLFLVMCSLLTGCFIPIAIGVFMITNTAGVTAAVLMLSGVAGVLLFLGAILILASEGAILNSNAPEAETIAPAGLIETAPPTTPLQETRSHQTVR